MNIDRSRIRPGVILIVVLSCLLVATTLIFAGVQCLVRSRQEIKDARLIRQTQLLVEAGVLHALKKLRSSSDYQGEVWKPNVAMLVGWSPIVEIREEKKQKQDNSGGRTFTVVAKLQSNTHFMQVIQESFQFNVHPSEP